MNPAGSVNEIPDNCKQKYNYKYVITLNEYIPHAYNGTDQIKAARCAYSISMCILPHLSSYFLFSLGITQEPRFC